MHIHHATYTDSTVGSGQSSTQGFVATVQLEAPPPDPNGIVVEFDASMLAGNSMAPVKVRMPSTKMDVRNDSINSAQTMEVDHVAYTRSTVVYSQVGNQTGTTRRIEVLGGTGKGGSAEGKKVDQIEVPANQLYQTKDDAVKACAAPRQVISVGSNGNPSFLCVPKESIVNK